MVSLILALLIILMSIPAWATTRYVDPVAGACTGNYSIASRNCTGSDGNSYATFALALSPTAAGDAIYLRTGTYTARFALGSKTGTAGSYITISSYNGETVTIAPTGSGHSITQNCSTGYFVFNGFIFDGTNMTGESGVALFNCSNHHFTFTSNEMKEIPRHVILINGNGYRIQNNYIHNNRSDCVPGNRWYGLYVATGDDILIEHNEISFTGGGYHQLYPGPLTNVVVRYNYFHDNGYCSTTNFGGIIAGLNTGTQFYNNVSVNNGSVPGSGYGTGLTVQGTGGAPTDTIVRNNLFYGNQKEGLLVEAGSSAPLRTIVENNLSVGNGLTNIRVTSAPTTVQTTNRTTGSITDCTTSTSVFTHKAASSCINAGTIRSGFSYNGSAPDQGAFETFIFSSCQVTAAATSTIRASFTNNLFPPLLPASSVTGVTGRKNGANNIITASSRSATNQFDFTMTNSYVAGNTVDISASSTNITDSAAIGSTIGTAFYQPYVGTLTNQSCTNNAGGAPAYTYTQARYEFHSVDGTEAAPRMKPDGFASTGAAEDFATLPVRKGGSVRLRFALVCGGADCPDTAFYIYYAQGGAYALVPDTFGAGNVATCGDVGSSPNNGTATTNQLSTAGTFVTGGYVNTSNAIPEISGLLNGYKTENEYCVKFDTDASGTYTFRAYLQDGIALNTYTVTPTVTITESKMGAGF